MSRSQWTDADWQTLVRRIANSDVTPVIGAGGSASIIGTGAELATAWAGAEHYPFGDESSLPAVAQYVATTQDRARPGEYIRDELAARLARLVIASIDDPHHPYRALPQHAFKIWLTTNYDDLISRALYAAGKPPRIGAALWTPPDLWWDKAPYDLAGFTPEPEHPLVFHLHGRYDDPPSMVITEGHYLEFLEQMASPSQVLPEVVEKAIASTSLLFIGYSFRDVNLQLVLRRWSIPHIAYAVRPFPADLDESQRAALADYTPDYLRAVTGARFKLYWGSGSQFCAELDERISDGGPP